MLDQKGFDLWAEDYDKLVGISEEKTPIPLPDTEQCSETSIKVLCESRKLLFWTLALEAEG